MRILMVHNHYKSRGGEDIVFEQECSMLESNGHEVIKLYANNDNINSLFSKMVTALGVIHSFRGCSSVREKIKIHQPDAMHVHNFFPKFSPAIFNVAHQLGVPTILTLHDFRIVCPSTSLLVNGKIDERSLKGNPFLMVSERVYKGSWFGTLVLASMIQYHKTRGTWLNDVDCFVALTEFNKLKFIQAGLDVDKISVKPNFLINSDKLSGQTSLERHRRGALYVGRITEEKGLMTLLDAWRGIDYPLTIIGDGDIEKFQEYATENVIFLGEVSRDEVEKYMKLSLFLVLPSEVYEGFPMSLCEAYFSGLPVIASDLGSLKELIDEGKTGLKFKPEDSQQLRTAVKYLISYPEKALSMGRHALDLANAQYTEKLNYKITMDIYESAISRFDTVQDLQGGKVIC